MWSMSFTAEEKMFRWTSKHPGLKVQENQWPIAGRTLIEY